MIKEIYLVPHSHTDIGYTHPQPIVLELHRRFLEEGMGLAEATADRNDGSAFRWNVEVSGTALDWWRLASSREKDRFVAAAQAGQIEVAAMRWNQAHLSDHHMLLEAMAPVRELRAAGVPIRSAMNTDVNGVNWGIVDVMLDHGIENFSMAINEHFGHAVRPRPQAFNWQAPSGRTLLVHNGLMYGIPVSGWLGIPLNPEKTRKAVPRLVELLHGRGYPHSVLIMQTTNYWWCDNNSPNPALPDYVRQFNAEGGAVKLRIATLSEAFDRLRQDDLSAIPTLSGDWPDWWTFGSGGTMRETAVTLGAQRALREAQQLRAWATEALPRSGLLEERAADALGLYVEHTYTADRAARRPDSPDVDNQIHWKKAQAYEAQSLARMLRRDGLAAIAASHPGEEVSALIYNPHPFPVKRNLPIPKPSLLEPLLWTWSHVIQRQDVEYSDTLDDDTMVIEVDLPALGYAVLPYDRLKPASGKLSVSDGRLANDDVDLLFDTQRGGLTSYRSGGTERLNHGWDFAFGVPVLETPQPAERTSLYGPPVFNDIEQSLDMHAAWHPNWIARREAGRLVETRTHRGNGFANVTQLFSFSNGDTASVTYRLSPGDAAVGIDVTIDKQRIPTPHSYYLPMPLAADGAWTSHYETAGAVVELDREQLPGANRHFVPTQRFIRLQGETRGVSVASPDLPLFQVGGFTFGRHDRGVVERPAPVLLAWLNNNYWDTNFEVTQSGPLHTRFWLVAHAAEAISGSVRRVLPYAAAPQFHAMKSNGPASASLLDIAAEGLMITGMSRDGDSVRIYVLNLEDSARTLRLGPAAITPRSARLIGLDGSARTSCEMQDNALELPVPARAWLGVELEV